ncbi:carboxylesterase/lipase family protein [Crossiella sp. S99.1]|uniref:carboxylesterase/lipase family protein n=2 Tax=unclassified Crossiella TaxID=2620835 RepID=UPI001FFE32BD|nr:carboxylesterase family protein [Crossiella sp. S99.1]MCK2241686.1 carboxylesterase family protein [Crossiella sp. S99.2]MCK2255442.1 carboxylesterase family protein [Crossiella sp. S99.1]
MRENAAMTTVSITSGALRGVLSSGVRAHLGVPYAAPPLGDLRFAAPAPVLPWAGVRDATAPGLAAVQDPAPSRLVPKAVPGFGEDCLTVNVWAPEQAEGLPVLVWLHGGLFQLGSASAACYSGEHLAHRGVVVVGVNYRLGALGYLRTPEGEGNFGLQDQLAALEWVRDNIGAFGGDPDQVTVAGQSAGAYSILALATLPRARGLFRRVILQSTPFDVDSGHEDRAILTADLFRTAAGIPDGDLAALRALSIEQVLAAQLEAAREWRTIAPGSPTFIPYVDGQVLTTAPGAAAIAGGLDHLDLMIGCTAGERIDGLPPHIPPDAFAAHFVTGSFRLAEHRAEVGRPVPFFWWRWPDDDGVYHCAELPYVFGTLAAFAGSPLLGGTPDQQAELVEAAQTAWIGFVRTGDPGWPGYTLADRQAMAFDLPAELVTLPAPATIRPPG